ncbi:MAG: hypothetical protein WAL80_15615 [Xanthobacteraceae bacterium]
MNDFTVFYAWQSDTNQRLNRYLIRTALELAARNISADRAMDVRVRVDADTEGVLGHVPVTDTILEKIAICNAFVPDLTFVATTGAAKLLPNANVMLEYGYALRAKTHSVILPVMNSAYGPATALPFDMGHRRFPLQYNLPPAANNADRHAARKKLSAEIESILREMIAAANAVDQSQAAVLTLRQETARRYLSPELNRTIERVLYIHSRAIPNFICASAENNFKPNDLKEDFIPYRPTLYPSASEVRELPADDAAALSAFYDSLISLADFVNDWWGREGQLPVNIFNMIMHHAQRSLELALVCIEKFDLERQYPPKYEAHDTISSRIKRSMSSAADASKHHIARFEAKAAKGAPPRGPKTTAPVRVNRRAR